MRRKAPLEMEEMRMAVVHLLETLMAFQPPRPPKYKWLMLRLKRQPWKPAQMKV